MRWTTVTPKEKIKRWTLDHTLNGSRLCLYDKSYQKMWFTTMWWSPILCFPSKSFKTKPMGDPPRAHHPKTPIGVQLWVHKYIEPPHAPTQPIEKADRFGLDLIRLDPTNPSLHALPHPHPWHLQMWTPNPTDPIFNATPPVVTRYKRVHDSFRKDF
jgi:hypothetical protein